MYRVSGLHITNNINYIVNIYTVTSKSYSMNCSHQSVCNTILYCKHIIVRMKGKSLENNRTDTLIFLLRYLQVIQELLLVSQGILWPNVNCMKYV